jgi:hypothetical protein
MQTWSTHVAAQMGVTAAVAVPALTPIVPPAVNEVAPARPVASDWRPGTRTAGYVALGLGGASLAIGAVFGGLALSAKNDMKSLCVTGGDDHLCTTPDAQRAHQLAESRATASTVGFALGGGMAAVGVLLLVIGRPAGDEAADKPARSSARGLSAPDVSLSIAPTVGGALLSGSF